MSRSPQPAEPLDVVAVGAHPDDVEIGCGGTVAKLVEQGHRVAIVDLTDGEPTPGSSGPAHRLDEAKRAAEVLGVERRVTLELPNRRLFDCFEARVALATELRRLRPQLVLGLGERTPLASPDHWQAMQITDAAVFYSRLTKWDDQFAGLPPHTVSALLHYPLALQRSDTLSGDGRIIVDIGSTFEKKLAAIRCYASQFPPEKEYVFGRVATLAQQHGLSAGIELGELLVNPRAFATRDLMGLLFS